MESGLDLEKQISTPLEAELFFLSSPFIELIVWMLRILLSLSEASITKGLGTATGNLADPATLF
jgi:hypothetical protein